MKKEKLQVESLTYTLTSGDKFKHLSYKFNPLILNILGSSLYAGGPLIILLKVSFYHKWSHEMPPEGVQHCAGLQTFR